MVRYGEIKLTHVAGTASQLPEPTLPEIAFVGRSNVGKSSLINRLTGRKHLCKTSGTPGKTRTINFFEVEEQFFLVDLPGYGFAKVSKTERNSWKPLIEGYLKGRGPALRVLFLLLDVRHKPSQLDMTMLDWLEEAGTPYSVILTKSDKLTGNKLRNQVRALQKLIGKDRVQPAPFSALKGTGRNELNRTIDHLLEV